jgi:tetrahydromethanopterin S-methyltransferase subunit B
MSMHRQERTPTTDRIEELKKLLEIVLNSLEDKPAPIPSYTGR